MLDLFHMIIIQGREPYFRNFIKYTFSIALLSHTCNCKLIFKKGENSLGLMVDMTKPNSVIPVWKTFTEAEGHKVMRKLDLVQSLCCKNGTK